MYETEVEEYQSKGFTVLRGFFSAEEIAELNSEISNYIENEAPKLSGRNINYVDGQINSIHALHHDDNYFTRLAAKERVRVAAAAFLASEAELRGAELFAKPAKVGLPSPIHQDNYYWCVDGANALTMWVALDHCDESNGGLTYYEGSHKVGIVDHTDSFAPGSSQKIDEERLKSEFGDLAVTIPAVQPGDVLVHHSLTFHGSSANTSGRSRRGFTMQFKDAHAGYDQNMKAHYESRLAMQVKAREEARAAAQ